LEHRASTTAVVYVVGVFCSYLFLFLPGINKNQKATWPIFYFGWRAFKYAPAC
jgi:hypothetical protein